MNAPRTPRALRAALGGLLPDATGSLLLRSCLAGGEECHRAWNEFELRERGLTELFRTDRGELKRLGPLLLDNLRHNLVGTEARLTTVLKTGGLREELRTRIYGDVLGQALGRLDAAGVANLVLAGAGLAEWAYRTPALRHSHDIDLLVASVDLERAVAALASGEFTRDILPAPEGVVQLIHRTSLPVRISTSAYELSCAAGSLAEMDAGSRSMALGGTIGRIPGAEVSLAYTLARAGFSHRRNSLQWACDAWMICARAECLDAGRFMEAARGSRLLLPSAILLRYLSDLGAPVAAGLLEAVERESERTTRLERDLALYGLRRGARGGVRAVMRRMPDAGTRLALLRWLALPSPAYLRWAHRPRLGLFIPALYLARAAGGLTELARRRQAAGPPVETDFDQ